MEVQEVAVEATYDLRRRVLREGEPEASVCFEGDDAPGAFHLAVLDHDHRPLAVATALPAALPAELSPGVEPATEAVAGRHSPIRTWRSRTWRVRGMAVEPALQGQGLGTRLLDAVVVEARSRGAQALWAAGRDTALGFYDRRGWSVEGEGYPAAGDLPHHTVVLELMR
ncbi:MAG: GNAT family N-acetyltransferase [Actinomycetota bacterium]|nr:GNAT family N-acetyltransferase [Actinomycetota bacterium]